MEENFGPDFITVTDEDGNDFELELVDTLEHKGVTYYAMFPAVEEDEATGEPRDVDADDEEYGLVIMKGIQENGEELPDFAASLDIPVVAITKPAAALDAVYVDHRSAGALVAEHLAERGYRRFLGFREKLAERGLAERTGSVAYESDRQLTHFLETWLRRPGGRTAVFAGNDIFALRTLSALRMLEVSVPRQAGVIGFDDTSTGRYLRPALSSVSQPIAGEAVSRLLWRIDHPRAEEILDLALPAELVVRESA